MLVVGIVWQYVHSVSTNVAYYLHHQREPLKDLGFTVLPALSRRLQILSEIVFFSFLFCTIVFTLSPFCGLRHKRERSSSAERLIVSSLIHREKPIFTTVNARPSIFLQTSTIYTCQPLNSRTSSTDPSDQPSSTFV